MGLLNNVKNSINGKKYLISTALASGYRWETAVIGRNIFGIPKMFHPLLRISAPNEHEAQIIHVKVEKLVAEIDPNEWALYNLSLIQDGVVAPEVSEIPPLPEVMTENSSHPWEYFRGKRNTKPILEEKANLLLRLVISYINDTYEIIQGYLKEVRPEIIITENTAWQMHAELGAFILSLINPLAFKFIGNRDRDVFMRILFDGTSSALEYKGVDPDYFHEITRKRIEEYSTLKWFPEDDNDHENTIFREFNKNISGVLNIGSDPMFKAVIENWLMRLLTNWQLNELFAGADD
jgi:hypothetical protein